MNNTPCNILGFYCTEFLAPAQAKIGGQPLVGSQRLLIRYTSQLTFTFEARLLHP